MSHGIVCGLNICLALVAFITLLGVLKRRNIALGGWGTAALCFLYWGGWKLAFVMQMGRIDILIMLFTLLVADALLPGANIEDGGTKSVAVYAFFLMLSGIYTVPFLILSSPLIAMLYRSNRVFVIKWDFSRVRIYIFPIQFGIDGNQRIPRVVACVVRISSRCGGVGSFRGGCCISIFWKGQSA